ncbi:FapA family protein [Virgibacillus sp. AGTR]|uniref:DUF342 domain-containing protein n=1 Tax=unclassified Virgibacillus TaxID=2620237 RepID=UPI001965EC3D|nr:MULTISPECIES: FapA family protein [unclassified Virgibacillus]MCC2249256.1 FapA family protein [Virgibacillus sp. AGTR]MDY7043918.1 FapA family protein [Virgibacillus sp. M23]QRZ17292.1 DUF342 domain-containing protein [Virgibacillus sp. AGTR]
MGQLDDIFQVTISKDKMVAQLDTKEQIEREISSISDEEIRQFLRDHRILYGVMEESISQLSSNLSEITFPITVAKGKQVKHGKDGVLQYISDFTTDIVRDRNWNFRDVMRIPTVRKGEKIAELYDPSEGECGYTIDGTKIAARPGRPAVVKAGKNVVYREEDQSFYAASEGQLSKVDKWIQIQPVFEVEETLSMKNGNLDFVGTIIIHGDVPTGYTVKAKGDVKIFGMVEAATVIAGGSVYVSEGLAGQAKGTIRADESIKIGYINQGIAVAGQDLYVENSILHSNCTVKGHVFCQKGNIIGGALSAGKSIEAKDIGNRLSTETEIIFGVDKSIETKERQLQEKKKELEDTLSKLRILGEKIKQRDIEQNPKLRITLLRQKNSWNKTNEQLEEVTLQLDKLNSSIGSEHYAELIVRNYIFSNVIVAFGKYRRIIKDNQHFVKMHLVDNEIVIYPLFE